MRVMDSELSLKASHRGWARHERREWLETAAPPARLAPERPTRADISEGARRAARVQPPAPAARPVPAPPPDPANSADPATAADPIASAAERVRHDPRMQLLSAMLRWVFGETLPLPLDDLADPDEALEAGDLRPPSEAEAASPPPAPAIESAQPVAAQRVVQETRIEYEHLQFSAQGLVRTADGRELRFELQMSLSRLEIDHRELRTAATQDPLVLNFDGPAASLQGRRWNFDLNEDGVRESLPGLGAGSAWLVFDRNGDGLASDGGELFGPRSGDGFAELAALDADGNGWIDEADPAWAQLHLWRPGGGLQPLSDAGVGALSLARLATPFGLRGAQGERAGELRSSGFYLREDGRPGSLQQVDLTV